jgi:hypothetical protein
MVLACTCMERSEQAIEEQAHGQTLEGIWRRIEHEDNLLNQRVSWIVNSQAFLLTGYAILLNAPMNLRMAEHVRNHALLVKLIPITSLCTTIFLWVAMLGGIAAMRALRACAKRHPRYEASQIQGSRRTRILGLLPIALVPGVFLVTWLLIVMR